MTEQEIERCLERFTMGKATDVMNFDYAGTLAYIQRLKAENAELKSSLTHANEECLKWHERAQNLLKDSGGSISGYEKKISDLQNKNATLRERLKKSIILPCKVGDIIYIITFGYNGKHVTPNNFADCWSYGMEEVEVTEGNLSIMCSHFRDGSAFFDRASAEARLAELKGGKYENF